MLALERAAFAIARLDARVSATCVREAWVERASWTGFAAALQGQGVEIEEIDVFLRETDVPLPQRALLATNILDDGQHVAWQASLAKSQVPHWRELVSYPRTLSADWAQRPVLLRALELTADHARRDRSADPALSLPRLLQALGIVRTPLPCLVLNDKAWRLAPRDRQAIRLRFLKHLASAADHGLARLRRLESDRARAAETLAQLRRPGQIPELLALLSQRPALSPRKVQLALGLTISGAGKLLARAAEFKLVAEVSGRQAWKLYLAPDLAIEYGFLDAPRGRPRKICAPLPRIDATLRAFDQQMEEIDAKLKELGVLDDDMDEGETLEVQLCSYRKTT